MSVFNMIKGEVKGEGKKEGGVGERELGAKQVKKVFLG